MISIARRACTAAIVALLAVPVGGARGASEDVPPDAGPGLSFKVDRQRDGTVVLEARGGIARGDAARLEEAVREAGAAEVWLDSPGGLAAEGMRIGRAVRSLGLTTRVDESAVCASACVDAFLGGVKRYVAQLGVLGVHRPTSIARPGGRERLEALVRERGLDEVLRMVEGANLLRAYEYASFLHEMGVGPELGFAAYQTPHAEMRRPTQKELREWRVVTGEWDPTGDRMKATNKRVREMEEEERRRAPEELALAERMQRDAEDMLQRSPDAETRRAAELRLRLAASIRRRAEAALARPIPND